MSKYLEKLPVYEVVAKENKDDFYWLTLECNNCGFKKSVAIPKGETAMFRTCPNCGCNNLERPE